MSTSLADRPQPDWRLAALAARVVVGGLFLVSAMGKIADPAEFAKEILAYEMVPLVSTNALAYILPWVELFTGALLLAGVWRKEARLIIAAMLLIFTIAKAYTYLQGKEIDCGCGGTFVILKYIYNSPQGIITNIVLLGLLGVDRHAERLGGKLARGTRRPADASLGKVPEST